jgi:cytochrome c oxidase cbb3-type subunit 3
MKKKIFSLTNQKFKFILTGLLLSIFTAHAQTDAATKQVQSDPPAWALDSTVYLVSFLILILLITIMVLYRLNVRLITAMSPKAFEKARIPVEASIVAEKKPTLMRRIYLRMVDSVPVAQEKDVLLDHDYDGIKELDNNLPPWWKYGFYFTIVFGFFYLIHYHVSRTGKLQLAEYQDELVLAEKQKEERMKANADNVTEDNVTALSTPDVRRRGEETFEKLCAACHRADGGGQVGPNLTDEYWLHGGGIKNVFKTITYGVPNKGMISWQAQLSPKQIQEVASYILTLKGTNPPGPKEPQGDIWVEAVVVDSTGKATSDTTLAILPDTLKK